MTVDVTNGLAEVAVVMEGMLMVRSRTKAKAPTVDRRVKSARAAAIQREK